MRDYMRRLTRALFAGKHPDLGIPVPWAVVQPRSAAARRHRVVLLHEGGCLPAPGEEGGRSVFGLEGVRGTWSSERFSPEEEG